MMDMDRRSFLGLLAVAAFGCGGKAAAKDASSEPDANAPVDIEYVPIAINWVKRHDKKAPADTARRLADDMLNRMQGSVQSMDAIAEASIKSILGDKALADEKRRKAVTIPASKAGEADLPPDAKEALAAFAKKAKPGDVVGDALGTGPVLVVARAVRGE